MGGLCRNLTRRRHDDDLHARPQPGTCRRPQSRRPDARGVERALMGLRPVGHPAVLPRTLARHSTPGPPKVIDPQPRATIGAADPRRPLGPGVLDCPMRSVGRATQLWRIQSWADQWPGSTTLTSPRPSSPSSRRGVGASGARDRATSRQRHPGASRRRPARPGASEAPVREGCLFSSRRRNP